MFFYKTKKTLIPSGIEKCDQPLLLGLTKEQSKCFISATKLLKVRQGKKGAFSDKETKSERQMGEHSEIGKGELFRKGKLIKAQKIWRDEKSIL